MAVASVAVGCGMAWVYNSLQLRSQLPWVTFDWFILMATVLCLTGRRVASGKTQCPLPLQQLNVVCRMLVSLLVVVVHSLMAQMCECLFSNEPSTHMLSHDVSIVWCCLQWLLALLVRHIWYGCVFTQGYNIHVMPRPARVFFIQRRAASFTYWVDA